MSTWNRLDLQTLGSQPIVLKNLPSHYITLLHKRGIMKRAVMATSFGVVKPHVDDNVDHHPKLHTFISNLAILSSFMSWEDFFGDFIHW